MFQLPKWQKALENFYYPSKLFLVTLIWSLSWNKPHEWQHNVCVCVCCVLISERKSLIRKWLCDKAVSLFVCFLRRWGFLHRKTQFIISVLFFPRSDFFFCRFFKWLKVPHESVFFLFPSASRWSYSEAQSHNLLLVASSNPGVNTKSGNTPERVATTPRGKDKLLNPFDPDVFTPQNPQNPPNQWTAQHDDICESASQYLLSARLSSSIFCPPHAPTHTHTRTRTFSHTLYSHPSFLSSVPLHAHIQI